jgi:hypothetical protein
MNSVEKTRSLGFASDLLDLDVISLWSLSLLSWSRCTLKELDWIVKFDKQYYTCGENSSFMPLTLPYIIMHEFCLELLH